MSATPQPRPVDSGSRRPVTLPDIAAMRERKEPIVMVTAYDFPTAQVAESAGVDIVLVGDSAAMTVLGYESTVPVTVDELLVLCKATRRGLRTPLLIGDLPFGSYERSNDQAIETAMRFVKEAGCDGVKIEGGERSAERARAMIAVGIPVMGHVGLTPQTATALGGFRAQGRTAGAARRLLEDALAIQAAGCFSIVFEAMPAAVAALVMEHMHVAIIGIGAGRSTDGQVLVLNDLLGIHSAFQPKFVKRFADVRGEMLKGVNAFTEEVRARAFPGPEHEYGVDQEELKRFCEWTSPLVSRLSQ
ncbi:MAG: 3-methyl-2-oxobutanoate hydroxymethyltransferase [Actinomycetota bacterium]|nr:3-methyl-2-oxobutanoate hydroxymethyltransferase [Actinomycetota bacterium]